MYQLDFKIIIDKMKTFSINDESTHYIFLLPRLGKFLVNHKKAKRIYEFKSRKAENSTIED